jgi:hypothetical protein
VLDAAAVFSVADAVVACSLAVAAHVAVHRPADHAVHPVVLLVDQDLTAEW